MEKVDIETTKQEARRRIHNLVEDYLQVLASGKKEDFNEERVKIAFIVPFLEALGWNPRTDEVLPEQATLTGRADFGLRVGGRTKIFVEMKRFSKNLDGHNIVKGSPRSYAEQAIQYAWGMKADWAALTNFEETRLYDSHVKKPENGLVWKKPIRFTEYEARFDELWLVSKHSVASGALDAYKAKIERPPVDKAFLEDLMNCRRILAENIKNTNPALTYDQINETVQKILDRLIFIKNCEDRLIIPAESLWKRFKAWQETAIDREIVTFMMDLKNLFRYFDKVYNGKLFEKHPCEDLKISNEVLEEIIDTLYGDGHHLGYNFSVVPIDVLGQAYEMYIGSIIKEKEGKAKGLEIVEQQARRKAHGIYYTPEQIVDYIVKNTLGRLLERCKTPEDVSQIKVLDPACGSGSFLIKAFDVIKEWYDKYNMLNRSKDASGTLDAHILPIPYPEERILTENIFGVDLDPQAVEITILNLSLKAVKTKEKLPYMADHIKCGNSLIEDSVIAGIHAFTWKQEFEEVMKKGGFDVIFGNPPYVKIQTLEKDQIEYFYSNYESAKKHYDIYALFVEKGLQLLRTDGVLGFILPSKFFVTEYGAGLRKVISETRSISQIVDFKDKQVFEGATTYTCLLFLKKNADNKRIDYYEIQDKSGLEQLQVASSPSFKHSLHDHPKNDSPWIFASFLDEQLMSKLEKGRIRLGDFCSDIFQGFLTGRDQLFFVNVLEETDDLAKVRNSYDDRQHLIEKKLLKKLLKGKDIRRWTADWKTMFLVYPYKEINGGTGLIPPEEMKVEFPKAYQYFLMYRNELMSSETSEVVDETNWYKFRRARSIQQFEKPKLLTRVLSRRNAFAIDESGAFYFVGGGNAGGFGILLKDEYADEAYWLLCLLNSNILEFYLRHISTLFRGGFYSYGKRFIERLPIAIPSEEQRKKCTKLAKSQLERTQCLARLAQNNENEKKRVEEEIKKTDADLNDLVFDIYGITETERNLVELSLK